MSWLRALTEKAKRTFGTNNYRAQMGSLQGIAIALLVVTVVVAVGSVILGGFYNSLKSSNSLTTTANSTLEYGQNAFNTIASYLPLIALVVVAVIIIALILRGFGGFGGREEV